MSKVVVITGGGNGFGKSLVQAFLERNLESNNNIPQS